MKKYGKILIIALGVTAFLASCQCKQCTKDSEISVTICLDTGSQAEYDNLVAYYEAYNYTCR